MTTLDDTEIASLIYLSILLFVVLGAYIANERLRGSQKLQQAAIWLLIFLGAIAIAGMWPTLSRVVTGRPLVAEFDEGTVISVLREPDGHYYMTLDVNNVPLRFVIDTGATQIVLSRQSAEAVGIDVSGLTFLGRANTANGVVRTAPIRLEEIRLGPLIDTNVPAVVNSGDLFENLLGMSYLQNFGRIEIRGNILRLIR